ncbi:MAG: TerD family protein [Muribaculaceae bacterium]|nr:TerD family protein [Muribaculaceae bacterium]MDE6320755.1 TerD family protein [Muribaculaceae bacterium]
MIINSEQNLTVTLSWGGDIDLDLTAFLLGQNALVMEDGGVVFYNSLSRDQEYDQAKHGDHQRWREVTRPMSPDGAVRGSADATGNEGNSVEKMSIDLTLVAPEIRSVMVCVTSSVKDGRRPAIVEAVQPELRIHDGNKQLASYNLSNLHDRACGYEAFELVRGKNETWQLKQVDEYHDGGLVELLEKFV